MVTRLPFTTASRDSTRPVRDAITAGKMSWDRVDRFPRRKSTPANNCDLVSSGYWNLIRRELKRKKSNKRDQKHGVSSYIIFIRRSIPLIFLNLMDPLIGINELKVNDPWTIRNLIQWKAYIIRSRPTGMPINIRSGTTWQNIASEN